MIGVAWWQGLLDALGTVLAWLYDVVPNYGVAIILLTVGIRVILLPLGVKQIRSMHAMQSIQPKVKALQTKYKGNKQKLNEEIMKLYREHGVNPLSGCWPMLLQLPVLIALFSVLRFPGALNHLPDDSKLHEAIKAQQGVDFLSMNLLCSPQQAGQQVKVQNGGPDVPNTLDCGSGIPIRIPYYVLALLMIGTTYYQQRQMQKASPPGASQQQQALTRVMPLLFGIWGFLFPSGLVLYWSTSNAWQIGQQHFMLKARKEALAGSEAAGDGKKPAPKGKEPAGQRPASAKGTGKPARRGRFQSMLDRAEQQRERRLREQSSRKPRSGGGKSNGGDRKKRRKR